MSHRKTFLRLADENGWDIDSEKVDDLFRRDGMRLAVEYWTQGDRAQHRADFHPASDGLGGFAFTLTEFSEIVDVLMLPAGESVRIARNAQ